jgi:RNA polymerase sigma-70 factor (sigma-E family)
MDFEQFAATRLDAVLRFATVLTNDRGLAEDVVQEVLIRAHRRWTQIESLDQPEAYVRRMIVNEFYSWRRKWARYLPRPVEPGGELDRTVDDETATITERRTLLAEVAKLPRKQRAVMVLRYYEDLPDVEIAAALGCTESTVRGYAFRALKTLRIELAPSAALPNQT